MPDRSRNKKPSKRRPSDEDENVIARRIVDEATEDEDEPTDEEPTEDEKREAARILGRLGGLKGGPARAEKLTAEERSEIARKAAQARWEREKQPD